MEDNDDRQDLQLDMYLGPNATILVSFHLTLVYIYISRNLRNSLTRANEATSECQTPNAKHNLAATDTYTQQSPDRNT